MRGYFSGFYCPIAREKLFHAFQRIFAYLFTIPGHSVWKAEKGKLAKFVFHFFSSHGAECLYLTCHSQHTGRMTATSGAAPEPAFGMGRLFPPKP